MSFAFATLPREAHALSIQPPITDIVAQVGETQEVQIQLLNDTDFVEVITLRAQAFIAGEQEGIPEFIDDQPYTQWFHLPQKEIVLQAGQSHVVTIPLVIPLDAEPGGYFAAIFARAQPQGEPSAGSVSYANEVGSLVFITVKGEVVRDLSVSQVQGSARVWGPTRFNISYTLHNNGTIHEIPRGTVSVRNIFSGEQNVVNLNEEELRLLPQSQRTLTHTWSPDSVWHSELNPARFGIYEVSVMVEGVEEIKRVRILVWPPAAPMALVIVLALFYTRKKKRS